VGNRITLSLLAVDTIRQHLRIRLPEALPVPSHGEDMDERAVLLRRGWDEIIARGLGRPGGVLDPWLEDAFALLARPQISVHAYFSEHREERRSVFVAMYGQFGALATVRDGEFVLEDLYPASAPRALVAMLPERPAGRGMSVTLPTDQLRAAAGQVSGAGSPTAVRGALRATGMRDDEAEFVAEALTAERTGGGQIGAKHHDRIVGRTMRVPFTVDYIDTARGRYLVQHKPGPDGRRWCTFAPGDRNRLIGQVGELIQAAATMGSRP